MIVTVKGRKFTLASAARQWLRDYWGCARGLLLQISLGSIAVALLSIAGSRIGIAAMTILLVILFAREWRFKLFLILDDSALSLGSTTAATVIVFAAIVYVPFFAAYAEAFLARTLIIVGTACIGALVLCLFGKVFFWKPLVFDNQVCAKCGVSMEVVSYRYDTAWEDTQEVAPGKMIRSSGGLRLITNLRCPNCRAAKTNVV
ncbi:MAG: hypothetical protein WBC59_00635 [Phycisphaerae bacterium]